MSRDANPGGAGGKRMKIQTNQPRGKTSHRASNGRKGGCAVTAIFLLSLPATGVWTLIERLVT